MDDKTGFKQRCVHLDDETIEAIKQYAENEGVGRKISLGIRLMVKNFLKGGKK